jgi:lipoprotein-anchoring transpeptidase ErfK/SrfK
MVTERQGDWVKAAIAVRPNGTQGWIKASDLTVADVPHRIEVKLSTHTLTVFTGNDVVMQAPVAVGTARTPTPTGNFFIDIVNPVARSGGVWGPFQLSVSGFSDVHKTFMGGAGQIAIHGTNRPELIGSDVSNGCIRMRNADIIHLASLVGVGTPVDVSV